MVFLRRLIKWALLAGLVLAVAYVLAMSGIYHSPEQSTIARLAPSPGQSGTILVAGATSDSGVELIRILRSRGETVVALVRASSNTAKLDALGVEKVVADALNANEVSAALASRNIDAVISLIGTSARDLPERSNPIKGLVVGPPPMDPAKRPDFIGNRNLVDAARANGVTRFILVTVIGAGDSQDAVPPGARRGHSTVIPLKTQAEDYLRRSGLRYTIIRPGGLGRQPPGTSAVLVEDPRAFSFLSRADLARLTAGALGDPATIGKTYTAYDSGRRMLWQLFTN